VTIKDKLSDKFRTLYSEAEEDVFGVLAEECIRQMEFARRKAHEEAVWEESGATVNWNDGSYRISPLTPAPEDWKP